MTYTTAGEYNKDDYFAFISRDSRLNTLSCHLFLFPRGGAEPCCKQLSRAFQDFAKQAANTTDPFLAQSAREEHTIPELLKPFVVGG